MSTINKSVIIIIIIIIIIVIISKQTDRQTDRQTGRQTGRQPDSDFTGSNNTQNQGNNVLLKYFTISIQLNFS